MSHKHPRFSAFHAMLIVFALSGGYAVAQDLTGLSHHQPAPLPAQVVQQLGLSGNKAGQVQAVLEHEQQLRQQIFTAIKADHAQLKQWLSHDQLKQLRQIEHPGWEQHLSRSLSKGQTTDGNDAS